MTKFVRKLRIQEEETMPKIGETTEEPPFDPTPEEDLIHGPYCPKQDDRGVFCAERKGHAGPCGFERALHPLPAQPKKQRKKHERVSDDFYPTPGWCVRRLFEVFDPIARLYDDPLDLGENAAPVAVQRWLEPGVGEGSIVRAVNEWYIEKAMARAVPGGLVPVPIEWRGFDSRETSLTRGWPGLFAQSDLDAPELPARLGVPANQSGPHFHVAIGNPPYNKAAAFIDFARKHAETVIMLLRLNFLGSDKRAAFMRQFPPDVYVLPNRPSFVNDGRTDSTEYAWFVWTRYPRQHGIVRVLAQTPDEERKKP